jgi:uncharacterized protein (TIGR02145 family)
MRKITVAIIGLFICFSARSQDTYTDSRDGEVYKTVTIDGTTWMSENLRFETKKESESWRGDTGKRSRSYAPILAQDKKFDKERGRYYSYDAALKACPTGWTLASTSDFAKLSEKFGGDKVSGHKLKSKTTWAWTTNGDNSSGFDAKAYGIIYTGRNLYNKESASFWAKGKLVDGDGPSRTFTSRHGNTDKAYVFINTPTSSKTKMSVRCVKK